MVLVLVVVGICVPCTLCATFLWCRHVLPRLRAQAASSKRASTKGAEEQSEPDEEEFLDGGDPIEEYLDATWQPGMDDHPEVELNPILTYKIDEEKRAALRAAAEASEEGDNPTRGVPGAIARLGWALDEDPNASKEEMRIKDTRRRMKNIEGYLARTFDADVSFVKAAQSTKVSGANGVRFGALDIAKQTADERVGGRRGSTMMIVAQKGREQLARYMAANPGGPMAARDPGAYGSQPDRRGSNMGSPMGDRRGSNMPARRNSTGRHGPGGADWGAATPASGFTGVLPEDV